jgi:hypothetical protein
MATTEPQTSEYFEEPRGKLSLWTGLLAAPIAFLLNLQAMYMLVTLTCDAAGPWLHVSARVTFALAAAGGWVAWRDWRRTGARWPGQGGDAIARSRFLAALGVLGSALFALVIVAQWLATWFLGPCTVT